MRLSALLSALPPELGPTNAAAKEDPVIRGLVYDSRAVAAGDLFFALRGSEVDGHDYLGQALALGAAAVVVEEIPAGFDFGGRPVVAVVDSRRAMAPVATRFYGAPSSELKLIGVTGTNGKTSVTYLVESILGRMGRSVGLIGTVEIRHADERQRSVNTTPESLDLQRTLRAMRTRGIQDVVMEVSSHGLELGRVDGCRFAIGSFTNLTQDHLDFHGTMESYLKSKARLFESYLADDSVAVVNVDDPAGGPMARVARSAGARVLRVSRDKDGEAEIRLGHVDTRMDGTRARVHTPTGSIDIELPLIGDFNVENLLVACGIAVACGANLESIAAGVASCPQVPGRVQRVDAGFADAPTVLVDYAHTPDAVEKLLRTLRPLTSGRLITVFGCGGDRDRAKRSLMAEAVARWSDRVVATSDNPRTEDPMRILGDVEGGLSELGRVEADDLGTATGVYAVVEDRRSAIELALSAAVERDTVVIAGKGHEDYQIVGRKRLPFSDRDEARRVLARRGAA